MIDALIKKFIYIQHNTSSANKGKNVGELTPSEIRVLYLLIKSKSVLTIEELSKKVGLSPSHTGRIMKKLERLGLISHVTASIAESVKTLASKKHIELPSSTISGKTKLYFPLIEMNELIEKYPEIANLVRIWEESEKNYET